MYYNNFNNNNYKVSINIYLFYMDQTYSLKSKNDIQVSLYFVLKENKLDNQ